MAETDALEADSSDPFGSERNRADRFAEILCGDGVLAGVIGPKEVPRIWERHLLNSLAVSQFLPAGATVADLGSGAGLPGIPLALARPDLHIILVEPLARRVRFLSSVVESLGLGVEIRHSRAQDAPAIADVVVARAVARLGKLMSLAGPMLRTDSGRLVALKGASVSDEILEVQSMSRAPQPDRWILGRVEEHHVTRPVVATVITVDWPACHRP